MEPKTTVDIFPQVLWLYGTVNLHRKNRVPDTWPLGISPVVFSGWFMSWKIALKLIKIDDQWGSPMSGNPQKIWDY